MTDLVPSLVRSSGSKIVLVVMDGLGGIRTVVRPSEVVAAHTPNLDRLAAEGSSGVHNVVAPGITPGSGAGHLALFGYDPLVYRLGRGALSAAGVNFDLRPGDVAARVNFCTLDDAGRVVDRRAGRIATQTNERLCKLINDAVKPEGELEMFLVTEREHRALFVLRGMGLSAKIKDTDPGVVGITPDPPVALEPAAEGTALTIRRILDQIRLVLADQEANFILLRGFDSQQLLPSFDERYLLDARGIAGYPMYLGIARLLGMTVQGPSATWENSVQELQKSWDDHDYFFLHLKATDSAGEDGDYERKKAAIEMLDTTIPAVTALGPGVVCVTGDHSTPAALGRHSWHPVPFVMWGPTVGVDSVTTFDEEAARQGNFGYQLAKDLMTFMLAAAGRLSTYGA
ncbi:MAG: 2,3-bisphosphoglycerate-independent phosphoglycerate mutase [Actinomycetota bacterium]